MQTNGPIGFLGTILLSLVYTTSATAAQPPIFQVGTECVLQNKVQAHHKPRAKNVEIDTLSAQTRIRVDKKFRVWVRVKINDQIRFIRPAPFKALCSIVEKTESPKEAEPAAPGNQTDQSAKQNPSASAPAQVAEQSGVAEAETSQAATEIQASILPTSPSVKPDTPAASSTVKAENETSIPSTANAELGPKDENVQEEVAVIDLDFMPETTLSENFGKECDCSELSPLSQRSGAYFGLGLGIGGVNFLKAAIANGSALNMNMRFGYAINTMFLTGIQFVLINQVNRWKENKPINAGISTALFETQIFPVADLGLNLQLAAGWTSVAKFKRLANIASTSLPTVVSQTGEGPAYSFGVGHDFSSDDNAFWGLQARYDGANVSGFKPIHGGSLTLWVNWY